MVADLSSKKAPAAAPVVLDTFNHPQIRKGALTTANQSATPGIAFQAGFDNMFSRDWGINLDVEKIFLNQRFPSILWLLRQVRSSVICLATLSPSGLA